MNKIINEILPTHVCYAPKNKECKFVAVGVVEVVLPPNKEKSQEKCIFSQELLSCCEKIGAIVYSDNDNNGPLSWKYLCNGQKNLSDQIHIFDFEYLKQWVNHKTALYLHCPLCKEGINEEKEHIEEHDIESMEQLKERREQAKKEYDVHMQYHVEQLILDKACEDKWDINIEANKIRMKENELIVTEILNSWNQHKKIDEFKQRLLGSIKIAIEKDNVTILQTIIQYGGYSQPNEEQYQELQLFLNEATKYNAFDCVRILLKTKNIQYERRPIALLNAVKTMNKDLIDEVLNHMLTCNIAFVCDDIFKEIIRKDLVDIAKKIVEIRWHKPTNEDYDLAEKWDGLIWDWLKKRRDAVTSVAVDDNVLSWDDFDNDMDDDDNNNNNNNNNNGNNNNYDNNDDWDDDNWE